MGCFSNSFAGGAQAIIDAALSMAQTGWPVYYRTLNETVAQQTSEAAELGFQVTNSTSAQSGVTDIQIVPQPRVKNINMDNIAMTANSAVKLDQTSRLFIVSNSFVLELMSKYPDVTDPELFWDGFPQFVGLMYNGCSGSRHVRRKTYCCEGGLKGRAHS
jgi:hypothetical protein